MPVTAQPLRHKPHTRRVIGYLLALSAFPAVYFAGASCSFITANRAHNLAYADSHLPQLSAPSPSDKVLIIAPHCDDEVLACAGLIQRTLHVGGQVEVVVVTNGDGYPSAVARQKRVVHAEPSDFIQFAEQRQQESLAALKSLGVPQNAVHFLGYPDGGMVTIWSEHWNHNKPYKSRFTESSQSPYPITYRSGNRYCGHDVSSDLCAIIRAFKPTKIASAHPVEDHTDHAAVGTFAELAYAMISSDPACTAWASRIEMRHYLVHRGDWPAPQGMHPELAMVPPAPLSAADTAWSHLVLTHEEEDVKHRAIQMHVSQTALMPAFMDAFVRRTELFGDIPHRELAFVQPPAHAALPSPDEWRLAVPTILDASRDNVLRDLQGGGDILAVTALGTRENLCVRVRTRRPARGGITVRFHARTFDHRWNSNDKEAQAICTAVPGTDGTALQAAIPWANMGAPPRNLSAAAIWVQSEIAGVEVDRTEIRIVRSAIGGKL